MFQPPAAMPRTAHFPLLSAVISGPLLAPLSMRSLSFAPATGFPVFLSTTLPDSRLSPRQSSAAMRAVPTSIAAAMIEIVFFKLVLLFRQDAYFSLQVGRLQGVSIGNSQGDNVRAGPDVERHRLRGFLKLRRHDSVHEHANRSLAHVLVHHRQEERE